MTAIRAHATPFYCPYCGEEDLVPRESHGEWSCQACRRGFRVSLTALATVSAPTPSAPTTPTPSAPTSATAPREDR